MLDYFSYWKDIFVFHVYLFLSVDVMKFIRKPALKSLFVLRFGL